MTNENNQRLPENHKEKQKAAVEKILPENEQHQKKKGADSMKKEIRKQLVFNETTQGQLEELKELLNASSESEAIRRALCFSLRVLKSEVTIYKGESVVTVM